MHDFESRVALVTGAAAGVGQAIARRLLHGGASVALVGHDAAGLAATSAEGSHDGRSIVIEADVRDADGIGEAVARTISEFGALHVAVNSAGITGPAGTLIEELALEDWERVVATDLTGMFLCLKVELPAIVASGGGAVLNLSSANGIVGVAGLSAYTAAKHGVVGLTRSAALEYADKGVRVNCMGPGYIATPRVLESPKEVLDGMAASHPLGRLARPGEVAEMAAFLLSEKASFCTGGFYSIDGGYTAR